MKSDIFQKYSYMSEAEFCIIDEEFLVSEELGALMPAVGADL